MTRICAKCGLDWRLGKNYLLLGWSKSGTGFLEGGCVADKIIYCTLKGEAAIDLLIQCSDLTKLNCK